MYPRRYLDTYLAEKEADPHLTWFEFKSRLNRNHDLRGRVNGKNCPQLFKDLHLIINDYVCPPWYKKQNEIKRKVNREIRVGTRAGMFRMHCVRLNKDGFWVNSYFARWAPNKDVHHTAIRFIADDGCGYVKYTFKKSIASYFYN